MLGLRYGTVELVSHRPAWRREFREERARLREALSAVPCEIEHVGSTAVPDLCTKPILDIAVGVAEGVALEPLVPTIEGVGYLYRGDAGAAGGRVFVRESSPRVRTHHVHLVSRVDPEWDRYLLFRELLRESPRARAAYARVKRELAARHPMNRRKYSAGKDEVVRRLLLEAQTDVIEQS